MFIYPKTVIAKTKTVTLGGKGAVQATSQRIDLGIDIEKQGLEDIAYMVQSLFVGEIQEQGRAGNPANTMIGDNRTMRALSDIGRVKRKAVAMFGVTLAKAAMVEVERELAKNISRATNAKTGKLSNIGTYWKWVHVSKGRQITLGSPQDIKDFATGDVLILKPTLDYATIVNNVVAASGSHTYSRGRKASKRTVAMGFLGKTAQVVKRRTVFRDLTIYAARTEGRSAQFTLRGEKSNQGTGFLIIRNARARKYRKV